MSCLTAGTWFSSLSGPPGLVGMPAHPSGGAAMLAEGQPLGLSPGEQAREVGGACLTSWQWSPALVFPLSSGSLLGCSSDPRFTQLSAPSLWGPSQPPALTTLQPPRCRLLTWTPYRTHPPCGSQAKRTRGRLCFGFSPSFLMSQSLQRFHRFFPVNGWQGAGTWVSAKRHDRLQPSAAGRGWAGQGLGQTASHSHVPGGGAPGGSG